MAALTLVVCVPVTVDGLVDPRWGRAGRVAVATLGEAGVEDWQEFDIGWDILHDTGGEGAHHGRVARFLLDHQVEAVVAHHMGDGMRHMLEKMGLAVELGATGNARESVHEAFASRHEGGGG
jgi:predicted Fe-Mo cluster-binding NifX family protein